MTMLAGICCILILDRWSAAILLSVIELTPQWMPIWTSKIHYKVKPLVVGIYFTPRPNRWICNWVHGWRSRNLFSMCLWMDLCKLVYMYLLNRPFMHKIKLQVTTVCTSDLLTLVCEDLTLIVFMFWFNMSLRNHKRKTQCRLGSNESSKTLILSPHNLVKFGI